MPWECTTIAGSMPILPASCWAAPSARGPGGTGRVNESCTMPSPVVSPYGRTTLWRPKWPLRPFPGSGIDALQQLQRRVVRAGGQPDDAVEALAAVRRALRDAEGAVGDRLDQALAMVGDPLQQLHRLGEHGVRAPVDEPSPRRSEVLGEVARGVQHVADVAQREVA